MNMIPSLPWLPPLVLTTIILIGILIGYWNGAKTATYFFVWNIVGLTVSLLIFHFTYGDIISKAPDGNIGDIIKGNKEVIQPIIGVIVALGALLGINIIAFLLYWIAFPIRRALKKTIKSNKKAGISNFGNRWVGASVGVITALPIAAFATSLSYVVSEEVGKFGTISSKLTNGLSSGQYNNVNENIIEVKAYVKAISDENITKTIQSLFGDSSNTPNKLTAEQKKTLETILNGKMLPKLLGDKKLVDKLTDGTDWSKINFSPANPPKQIENAPEVKSENRVALRDAIYKMAKQKKNTATKTEIYKFIGNLLGWN